MIRLSHQTDNHNPFIKTVERTIEHYRMFQPGDTVLAGVSGGPDSVAMIHALSALADRFSVRLGIAHLNHGLRGEYSDRDARFAESLAVKLRLGYYGKSADVRRYSREHRLSLEETGRLLRYRFYDEIAGQHGFSKIALGHHAGDQAELVLMNLLRGSGLRGISGMSPVRDGRIVRPLIRVTRAEIKQFLDQQQIPYVTDESNADIRFLRNRIRLKVIPVLQSFSPNVIEAVSRFSFIIRDEDQWMEEVIAPMFEASVLFREQNSLALSVSQLLTRHIAVQRRILRRAVAQVKGNLRRISFDHIHAIIRLLTEEGSEKVLDLPDQIRIQSRQDMLVISKEAHPLRARKTVSAPAPFLYRLEPPCRVFVKEIGAYLNMTLTEASRLPDFENLQSNVAFLDKDVLEFPLALRNVMAGDRFSPLGMSGLQKIKTYFINNKIPKEQRTSYPVLVSGKDIVWLVGRRTSETGKITASTRNVLKIEVILA